jgi:hypothetical protein
VHGEPGFTVSDEVVKGERTPTRLLIACAVEIGEVGDRTGCVFVTVGELRRYLDEPVFIWSA